MHLIIQASIFEKCMPCSWFFSIITKRAQVTKISVVKKEKNVKIGKSQRQCTWLNKDGSNKVSGMGVINDIHMGGKRR